MRPPPALDGGLRPWTHRLSITWFATVMGLGGLALVWQGLERQRGWSHHASDALSLASLALFALLAALYATKALRDPGAVRDELRDPVLLNFFACPSLSLVLCATALAQRAPATSYLLWGVGTFTMLAFSVAVVSTWINHDTFRIHHVGPAWFIPVVGNLVVPAAGVAHGHPELSWLAFSVGLVFWLVLMTIMFYRFIFHHPLAERWVPTLFILLTPPAAGFSSWIALAGGTLDAGGRILFYTATFFLLLLALQLRRFVRLPFYMSWWAYSFPLAAYTVAVQVMAELTGSAVVAALSAVLAAAYTALILLLVARTARAAMTPPGAPGEAGT